MSNFFDDPNFVYRMDDDDWGGGGDDDGGSWDGGGDDDDQGDDYDEDEDQQEDDEQYDDEAGDGDDGGDDGQGGDGDDGGGDDDDDLYNMSDEDLPEVDDQSFLSADDFPDADQSDFEDDSGDWTADDYAESAQNIFGRNPLFGDSLVSWKTEEGYRPYEDPGFARAFDQIQPGLSDSVHLFERDGRLHAFGVVSTAVLALLMSRYRGIDLSGLDVGVPGMSGPEVQPQPLPPAFANVQEKDAVDLRQYCTPVGDQQQTSRCSAFAWTHGLEVSRAILNAPPERLSPNHTMLQFQRMQGDARDYRYAYSGGDGTVGGPDPGKVLVEHGSCRQMFWPDDDERPRSPEQHLEQDAQNFRLDGSPWPIGIDDVKKVLSAGCPVHVAINTGENFSNIGRDGVFNAAETPSGRHGRHAMLLVGYFGNFYIIKNSWGTDWGDHGYCYIPKNVLAASEPEFIAILLKKPTVDTPPPQPGSSRSGGGWRRG